MRGKVAIYRQRGSAFYIDLFGIKLQDIYGAAVVLIECYCYAQVQPSYNFYQFRVIGQAFQA